MKYRLGDEFGLDGHQPSKVWGHEANCLQRIAIKVDRVCIHIAPSTKKSRGQAHGMIDIELAPVHQHSSSIVVVEVVVVYLVILQTDTNRIAIDVHPRPLCEVTPFRNRHEERQKQWSPACARIKLPTSPAVVWLGVIVPKSCV